jgi:hypothetical protein
MKYLLLIMAVACPSFLFAQNCETAQIYQHISEADTFNSSGAPLTDAAAILQQDRFYVNAKGRLDKYDQADNYFTNKSLRATYGQYWRGVMFRELSEGLLTKPVDLPLLITLKICASGQKITSIELLDIAVISEEVQTETTQQQNVEVIPEPAEDLLRHLSAFGGRSKIDEFVTLKILDLATFKSMLEESYALGGMPGTYYLEEWEVVLKFAAAKELAGGDGAVAIDNLRKESAKAQAVREEQLAKEKEARLAKAADYPYYGVIVCSMKNFIGSVDISLCLTPDDFVNSVYKIRNFYEVIQLEAVKTGKNYGRRFYLKRGDNVAAVMSNYDMILELQLYETKSDKLIKTKKIESVLQTLLMDVPD